MKGVLTRTEQKIEDWCGRKKSVIYLFVRGIDKKKYIFKDPFFEPYCYFRRGVIIPTSFPGEIRKHQIVNILGHNYLKVWTALPTHISKLRNITEKKRPFGVSVYEADVVFPLRYIIDRKIRGAVEWTPGNRPLPIDEDLPSNLRIHIIDIETLFGKIICLTIWDSYDKKYYTWYWRKNPIILEEEKDWILDWSPSEEEMLIKVINFMIKKDPDVITGFNVDFDTVGIRERIVDLQLGKLWDNLNPLHDPKKSPYPIPPPRRRKKKFRDFWVEGKSLRIPGRTVIDLLEILLKIEYHQLSEYSLEYIAQEYLNPPMEKLKWKGKPIAQNLHIVWLKDPALVLKYNRHDVRLCVELNKQQCLIAFADELRKFVGCQLDDVFSNKRIAHIELLRKTKKPLPVTKKEVKGYKGAIVIEPKRGVYKWIIVMDFRSLYPSIILQFNIDPETYIPKTMRKKYNLGSAYIIKDKDSGAEYWFKKKKEGDLPAILRNYLAKREDKRKEMKRLKATLPAKEMWRVEVLDTQQIALKVIANAFYGSLLYRGMPSAYQCARAITCGAREAIKFAKEEIEKLGYNVIYGDTDSIMIASKFTNYQKVKEEAEYLGERISQVIPNFLGSFGGKGKSYLTLALDKIFLSFLIDEKKKRYAGFKATPMGPGKLDIKGFGAVRSDSSLFTRNLQRTLIKEILKGRKKREIKFITEQELKGYDRRPLTEIGVPCVLTKAIDKYKTRSVQVKAFTFSNKYLKTHFGIGNKPKRIYVKIIEKKLPKGSIAKEEGVDVIAFEEDNLKLPKWLEIDWYKMVKQTVKPKLEKILKFSDLEWSDIKLKTKFLKPKKVKKKKKKKKRKVKKNVRKISKTHTKRKP